MAAPCVGWGAWFLFIGAVPTVAILFLAMAGFSFLTPLGVLAALALIVLRSVGGAYGWHPGSMPLIGLSILLVLGLKATNAERWLMGWLALVMSATSLGVSLPLWVHALIVFPLLVLAIVNTARKLTPWHRGERGSVFTRWRQPWPPLDFATYEQLSSSPRRRSTRLPGRNRQSVNYVNWGLRRPVR